MARPNIDLKQLLGILNSDDSNEVIPSGHHKMAFNMRFRGMDGNVRGESVPGSIKITNSDLPAGDNECIGSFYDGLKQRIIWFNWNSNARHGIYQYSLSTQTITPLFICFTNSQTDILEFDLDFPVASVNILYTTDEDGDIIHWVARNNRPMKLNIKDALANTYGSNWLYEYLTVARPQQTIPPTYTYQNDSSVNINNLRKKIFQFRYRPIYKDFTKATWSAWSNLVSPVNPDAIATDIDPTKNNRLDITLDTGNGDCTKIEIAARHSIAGNAQNQESTAADFSDPYLIITLDKEDLGLSDNSLYTYEFFNDGSYLPIDIEESDLEWDRVPYRANTQELLNGNVIIYGGITEGYNFDETLDVDSEVNMIDNTSNIGLTITLVKQSRKLSYYFDGGVNGVVSVTLTFTATPLQGDSATTSITYTLNPGDDIDDIKNGLFAQFPLTGFPDSGEFISNIDPPPLNPLNVFYENSFTPTPGIFEPIDGSFTIDTTGSFPSDVSIACYHPRSRYTFVLVYFDEFGATDGAHLQADTMALLMSDEETTTGGTASKIPQITFTVNHQPPIWAKTFSWARTLSLTFQRIFPMVSYSTKKDANYGYIEITKYQENKNNFPIYDFIVGDRVRILGEYVAASAGTVINSGDGYDFPIVDVVTNPIISGSTVTGIFIKVPFNSALNDFGTGHNNWFIEAYTPASNISTDQQTYWEFGENYPVLFPGEDNRAHGGQQQDQVIGVQPAIYNFLRGDFYQRIRNYEIQPNTVGITSVIDSSVSDLYPSRVQSIGRPFQVDEFAVQTYFTTMLRWSLQYEQNTSINQTNRFYPLNFDEIDRAKGAIQRFKSRERILRVFQNRGVGSFGVYAKFIQNNSGQTQLVTTNDIITKNNVNYYVGEYGMGDQYCDLVSASIASRDYFIDPVRGYHIRVSDGGMDALNELYKGQFYIRGLLIPYNQTILRPNGSKSKILGCYDYLEEQPMVFLQGGVYDASAMKAVESFSNLPVRYNLSFSGTAVEGDVITVVLINNNGTTATYNYTTTPTDTTTSTRDAIIALIQAENIFGATTTSIDGNPGIIITSAEEPGLGMDSDSYTIISYPNTIEPTAFSFNERRLGYCSFYKNLEEGWNPDWITCAEETIYSWKDGELYIHNDEGDSRTLYGVLFYPSIKLVFNSQIPIKKVFNAVAYQSNQIWVSDTLGDINTSMYSPQTNLQQISKLTERDYEIQENIRYAALLRDANSLSNQRVALWDGAYLTGTWIELDFTYKGSNFGWVFSPYILWQASPRNF